MTYPDDEWIYWCIDDYYPVRLNVQRLPHVYRLLATEVLADVSGVNFCGKERK